MMALTTEQIDKAFQDLSDRLTNGFDDNNKLNFKAFKESDFIKYKPFIFSDNLCQDYFEFCLFASFIIGIQFGKQQAEIESLEKLVGCPKDQ